MQSLIDLLTMVQAKDWQAVEQWGEANDMYGQTTASQLALAFAGTDELTGLLNRQGYAKASAGLVRHANRYNKQLTVTVLDLDSLKAVNDCQGHASGDALLKEFACVLSQMTRSTDVVGRLGGDEFVVLQLGAGSPEQILDAAASYASCGSFSFSVLEIHDAEQIELALSYATAEADKAMYKAKQAKRS